MNKKLILASVLVCVYSFSTNILANNDVAEVEAISKTFTAKWKEGLEDGKKNAFNKDYRECRNFSKKTALTIKHSDELIKLIHNNADKARIYAEPLFKQYMSDYSSADFEDTMYFVFDQPAEIAELCKDDEFSFGILKAMHAVLGY